jgi:hypothetical protein
MPKSSKTFILSTSQLNSHGFRTLTSGVKLDEFRANPIMTWMHMEPEGKSIDDPLPIGFWEDIKVDGDEITAVPNFDDNDPFAMKIYNKVEHGSLRAASIEVNPIKLDADKKNWVSGQKLPTVTEWTTGEAGIVDRGSNKGAVVKLKHDGKSITLSDQGSADEFFQSLQEKPIMKIKLNQKAAKALKLSADAEMDATDVVDKLVEVIDEQSASLKLKEDKISEMEKAEVTGRVKLMLNKAKDEGKIVAGAIPNLEKLALADEESVKAYLTSLPATQKLREQIDSDGDGSATGEVAELMKLSFDELHQGPGLAKLKALSPDSYKLKFKSKFGTEPTV